ncbi:unnamed protein product [Amoebophrya sp. A120]|nr:unnamed protein product [Amoebophrya sp. A120]|eukprot:GSA120T00006432001.1
MGDINQMMDFDEGARSGKGKGKSGKGGGGLSAGGGGGSRANITRSAAGAPFLQKIKQQLAQKEHDIEDKTAKRRRLAEENDNEFEDDIHEALFVDEETGADTGMSEFDQKMARKLQEQRMRAEQEAKEKFADADKPITFKLSKEKEEKRQKRLAEEKAEEQRIRQAAIDKAQQRAQLDRPEFYWRLSEEEKDIYDRCLAIDRNICFHFNTKRGCNKGDSCPRKHVKIETFTATSTRNSNEATSSGAGAAATGAGATKENVIKEKDKKAVKPKVVMNYDDDEEEESD